MSNIKRVALRCDFVVKHLEAAGEAGAPHATKCSAERCIMGRVLTLPLFPETKRLLPLWLSFPGISAVVSTPTWKM